VDAVRKVRDAYAKGLNYDLDKIYRDLKEKERLSHRRVVSYPATKTGAGAEQASAKKSA
jgi:hypothetical protein